jgi:FkbM family methyltransferase
MKLETFKEGMMLFKMGLMLFKMGLMLFKMGLMLFKMGLSSNDPITYYTLMLKYSRYRPGILNKLFEDLCRKNVYVKTYGVKLYLEPCEEPPVYSIFISINEPITLRYFSRFAREGGVVVDCGANVGIYSLISAKYANKVIAVEPNPLAYQALQKNVKLNGFSNVRSVNMAVWSSSGKARLYLSSHHQDSTLRYDIMSEHTYNSSIEVETITLDQLLTQEPEINLIKIDVEGAEVEALKGANEVLNKTKRIIVEVRKGQTDKEVLDILGKHNFKVIAIDDFEHSMNLIAEKDRSS